MLKLLILAFDITPAKYISAIITNLGVAFPPYNQSLAKSYEWIKIQMAKKLSHLDGSGKAKMVDVSNKAESERRAVAKGEVVMKPETLDIIRDGMSKKGDILGVAQIAGIMAAKRTSELIPLCHPVPISEIKIDLTLESNLPGVQIISTVKAIAKTGVEMEALTATAVAALTVYDMVKAIEKTMRIQNIRLVRKTGGVSGDVMNE